MQKYQINKYSVSTVLGWIKAKEVAIPEIQRPFVWEARKIRDLIDSLYKGFPVGYLIISQSHDLKLKDGSLSKGQKILIDGQQRVTALMTSLLGVTVLDDEYRERVYKIAYNPFAQGEEPIFEVQDQSHLKSKKWIEDISVFFVDNFDMWTFVEDYCNENPEMTRNEFAKKVNDVRDQTDAICAIFREMQKKRKHIDTTDLMVEINHIINENVEIEHQEDDGLVESRRFDISQIDFDLLAAEFAKVKRKNLMIKDLNDLVQERLSKMMSVNPSRVDYYVRYMGIIETYNAEQDRSTIEKTFMELMDLAKSMSEEEQRYAREGFSSDEELSIYDLLFSDNLSKTDIDKIKKMSKDLLQKIKERIAGMDHWTDKQETRAAVDILIRNVLYEEIPDSMFDRLETYRKSIYEYVYLHFKAA